MDNDDDKKKYIKTLGMKVSNCLLESSMCLVVGLGIGTALSIQRKNLRQHQSGG
jgi:hypothetical protein